MEAVGNSSKILEELLSLPENRKIRKPLMEKKRRARINESLETLKNILLECDPDLANRATPKGSKLEKADILEMTVNFLRRIKRRPQPYPHAAPGCFPNPALINYSPMYSKSMRVQNIQYQPALPILNQAQLPYMYPYAGNNPKLQFVPDSSSLSCSTASPLIEKTVQNQAQPVSCPASPELHHQVVSSTSTEENGHLDESWDSCVDVDEDSEEVWRPW
ncbi:enhancer of split m7 protein-like [Sitophilus oryzae]|uniref:Enhancer of split m7 protein-like n=1 Tax=Sitophilus oryzae TaxID=7048 RepID=A0A6J2XT27_SITOR|nr:enhancer of split m7 protein-like [Sitophilus oryzae]